MQVNIHNVVSVLVTEVRSFDKPHVFVSRAIRVTDDKGQLIEITLYGDTADQLEVKGG